MARPRGGIVRPLNWYAFSKYGSIASVSELRVIYYKSMCSRKCSRMKLPKYVYARASSYYYQRHYPTSVASVAPTSKFVMPLDAKVGASEREVTLAAVRAGEAFDLDVARLKNSSYDGAMEAGADALSSKVMKSYGLDDGDLAKGSGVRDIIEAVLADTFADTRGRSRTRKSLDS